MLKTFLIDDEADAIKALEWEIKTHCPSLQVTATFTNPIKALEAIINNPPDLIFLDIEMPRLNGFDLLDKVPRLNSDVIFVTAYDEYAVKAFRINAIDYLLKPIITTDLKDAIMRVKMKRSSSKKDAPSSAAQLERLKQSFNKISLANNDSIEFVFPHQILFCKSEGSYTYVIMEHKKMLITKSLGEIEEVLQEHSFIRTHRSYIVNLSHINKFVRSEGGYLIMTNNEKVPVSRRKKEELMRLF